MGEHSFSFNVAMTPDEIKRLLEPFGFEVDEPELTAEDGIPFDPATWEDDDSDSYDDEMDAWEFGVPEIVNLIFSGPATIIIWSDGTKTMVKCAEGQQFDRYSGFCACVCKKLFGSSSEVKRIMDAFDADKIREAEERMKEQRRRESEARENAARERKQLADIPSPEEMSREVKLQATRMLIERMAKGLADRIERNGVIANAFRAMSDTSPAGEEKER